MSVYLLLALLLSTAPTLETPAPAPAPAPLPEPAPSGQLLTIGFSDPGVEVNSTGAEGGGFPPLPPGLTLVREAPAIGVVICALDPDVPLSPAEFCSRLLATDASIAICEPDTATATISQSGQRPSASPDDPLYGQQYSLRSIGLPAAWSSAQLFGSTAIHVCVIDTGVDVTAPDFNGSVLNGTAFVGAQQSADYTDENGHGSFTAGALHP